MLFHAAAAGQPGSPHHVKSRHTPWSTRLPALPTSHLPVVCHSPVSQSCATSPCHSPVSQLLQVEDVALVVLAHPVCCVQVGHVQVPLRVEDGQQEGQVFLEQVLQLHWGLQGKAGQGSRCGRALLTHQSAAHHPTATSYAPTPRIHAPPPPPPHTHTPSAMPAMPPPGLLMS